MKSYLKIKITGVSLIITNLILMVLAIILDWKTYDQVMVFWSENLVIGFYTLIKIPYCKEVEPEFADHLPVSPKNGAIVMIPFFLLVFLMFCALHLAMIHMLFMNETEAYQRLHSQDLFPQINWQSVVISIFILGIHHGISLWLNFFGNKEYENYSMNQMLIVPFKRVILVHLIVLIFGLMLHVLQFNSVILICLFFLAKIWIDYKRHLAEHRINQESFFGWY
jgi:hypothetical protein